MKDRPCRRLWRLCILVEKSSMWWQALSASKKGCLPQNISQMRQSDAISWHGLLGHWGFIYIPLKLTKLNFHTWASTSLEQIGFLVHWGQRPLNFQNLKGPTYSILYWWLPPNNEIFPNKQIHTRYKIQDTNLFP